MNKLIKYLEAKKKELIEIRHYHREYELEISDEIEKLNELLRELK